MAYRTYLAVAMLGVLATAPAIPSIFAAQASSSDRSEKIKALMTQRRDVLAKRVAAAETQYKSGLVTLDLVISARDDLFEAELDLAPTQERRIELLRSRLKNIREGEHRVLELQKVGGRSETDALLATSRRLLAEIELERALTVD